MTTFDAVLAQYEKNKQATGGNGKVSQDVYRIRVGINNLFDRHNIVGVTPASTATNLPQPGDFLSIMAGRSVSVAMTFGFAPHR